LSRQRLRLAWIFGVAASVAIAVACGGDDAPEPGRGGPTRSFMMGISSLPRELNADAYAKSFELAGSHGELVLIQRTPPWQEFLPGAAIADATAQTTAAEKQAIDNHDLQVFFAIDATDAASGRDRIGGLPASHEGRTFADADVRAAFGAYAEYVAVNYKPDYLALGVEMNLYYDRNRTDFENFRSLYSEAYARVKQASPGTQVTMTLQYEDLQGRLPTTDAHFPQWELIQQFDPQLDVLAISSYPSFAFANAREIPDNYYSQLRGFTEKPIVIAEMGYSSTPIQAAGGGEAEQASFVRRVLAEAEALDMPAVIWFAGWDPSYARDTAFGAFEHIGLLRDDGSEKPAWQVWAEAAARPYAPDLATAR
jgi:hypothetical protein